MLQVPQDDSVIETHCYLLWQGNDGFIRVQYKPDEPVSLDDIKGQMAQILRLTGGERAYVLGDFTRINRITADIETRRYSGSAEAAEVFAASAILVSSGLTSMLGNIYLSIARPVYPIHLFKSEADALAWLRERRADDANGDNGDSLAG